MNTMSLKFRMVLVVICICIGHDGFSQLEIPRPSPLGRIYQKVGLNEITIEYSRPGVKDRVIFGDLVPYGELWRTGANAATKITLAQDAKIAGSDIPAGDYSLLTIPGKEEWTVIINKDPLASETKYDQTQDQLRFTVKPEKITEKVETFTINIEHIRTESALIQLTWENTKVSFKLETPADAKVMAQIDEVMQGISFNTYYQAANYYAETGRDLQQALEWMDKALQQKETFFMVHSKAKIQAQMGDYKGAIETARKSRELAVKEKSNDFIALNDKAIAKWEKMAR